MSASAQNDFDALLDLSEFDANYQSPSLSPNMSTKPAYASPISEMTPPSVSSTAASQQTMNGPSHNYDMYRQQTGFVPGALANTMAVNQSNNTGYQDFGSLEYLTTFSPENDVFDFNTSPSQATLPASDLEMDFDASNADQFFTVNPSSIEQQQQQASAGSSPSSVGRLWPGAHTQAAAVAKAQAQQRQMMQQTQSQKARGKAPQATDPIIEQKITQLLNNMRAKPGSGSGDSLSGGSGMPRCKKSEEDMDEDERLLASEEGKKLSSKERRQLRNKVSARAFRSRRKEYISQLESERDNKDEEVTRLRQSNRALMEENKRLSDLTRMLLSSSSFSTFLDHLSTNSAAIPQAPVKVEAQPEQEQAQVPKDVNPYGGNQSQQQIGMAMIPEQTMDYSMLALDGYNFQPTVFVVDMPEIPAPIDAGLLAGKTSNFVESFTEDDEKVEAPVIERPVQAEPVESEITSVDDKFESDPEYALFHAQSPASVSESPVPQDLSDVNIFGGVEAEKALSRFELVDATEEQHTAAYAMARVQRISASAESVVARLELLTSEL